MKANSKTISKTVSKTLVASAISALLVTTAYADPLTVYGKLNVSAQSNNLQNQSSTNIQSNASRLGVKGNIEISEGLEAIYTIEYEVDTGSSSKENFKARNNLSA